MSEADDSKALARLANKKVNYIAIPGADEVRMQALVSWIKSKRTNDKKTFKAVTANITADDEGIINFTTENIKVGSKTYTAKDYVCRIAGILAGLPFTRSSTNYELPEIESITEHLNPDEDIDNGQLILIFDGEVVKIGRGVNSLTTTSPSKGEKFKKIRVVEAIDLIRDDIKTTWIEMYSGKVNNTYNNKLLFLGAVNAYFKDLQKQEVLDPSFEALAEIDIESQRIYLQSIGVEVEDMKDQEIKEYPTGDKVFVKAKGSILDAMEDLDFGMLIA